MKLESVSLRRSENLTERWVQNQIADDPSILGLGDLILRDTERGQPHAERLDGLLQDPDALERPCPLHRPPRYPSRHFRRR